MRMPCDNNSCVASESHSSRRKSAPRLAKSGESYCDASHIQFMLARRVIQAEKSRLPFAFGGQASEDCRSMPSSKLHAANRI